MEINQEIQAAINLYKNGDKESARGKLQGYIKSHPNDETGWYVYAKITDNIEERIRCLERVLDLNPLHVNAKEQLEFIKKPISENIKSSNPTLYRSEINKISVKSIAIAAVIVIAVITIFGAFLYMNYSDNQKIFSIRIFNLTKCNNSYLERLATFYPDLPRENKPYTEPLPDIMMLVYEVSRGCDYRVECKNKGWIIYEMGDGCEVAIESEVNGEYEVIPVFYLNPETDFLYASDSLNNLGVSPVLFESQILP